MLVLVFEFSSMDECIEARERAFGKIPSGEAAPWLDAPCEREDGYYRWGTGVFDGIFSIRMESDVVTWPLDASGRWTEDKYYVEPGCGLVFLFSSLNGEPLINDGAIHHMRVGGGAGTDLLSRANSRVVGMLGSGGITRTYAFCAARDIELAKVYSPTKANRGKFASKMSGKLGIAAVDDAREAEEGVLSTATDSMEATFEADWLEAGMRVTNLGPDEVGREALDRIDVKRYAGRGNGRRSVSESGVGHSLVAFIEGNEEEMKRLPPQSHGHSSFRVRYPDYTGKAAGRTSETQITYCQRVGFQGSQFAAVGGHRKARILGKGREDRFAGHPRLTVSGRDAVTEQAH